LTLQREHIMLEIGMSKWPCPFTSLHIAGEIMSKKVRSIKQKGGFMSKKDAVALAGFFAVALLVIHALTIAGDVQAIIEDPNQANKPGEILKLAFDVTRYFD